MKRSVLWGSIVALPVILAINSPVSANNISLRVQVNEYTCAIIGGYNGGIRIKNKCKSDVVIGYMSSSGIRGKTGLIKSNTSDLVFGDISAISICAPTSLADGSCSFKSLWKAPSLPPR